jgi:hypothetical protein
MVFVRSASVMDLTVRYLVFSRYPTASVNTLAFLFSVINTPTHLNFTVLVLQLTCLLLYMPIISRRRHLKSKAILLWATLTISSSLRMFQTAWAALDSSTLSTVWLLVANASVWLVSLVVIFVYARLRVSSLTAGSRSFWPVAFFPAMWTTTWCAISHLSFIGRFGLPTPAAHTQPYQWTIPLFGCVFQDWLVAAWAVVLSEMIETWVIGKGRDEEEPLLGEIPTREQNIVTSRPASFYLTTLLIAFAFPSLFDAELPLERNSQDTMTVTVGCILPDRYRYNHTRFSLDDFMKETKALSSSTNIILWPEAAVVFDNVTHKTGRYFSLPDRVYVPYIAF